MSGDLMTADTTAWRRQADLAVVSSRERVAIVKLTSPAEPPRILDGTAAAIWSEVDGGRSAEAIVAALVERFHGDPDVIADEVNRFLHRLEDEGVLTREP